MRDARMRPEEGDVLRRDGTVREVMNGGCVVTFQEWKEGAPGVRSRGYALLPVPGESTEESIRAQGQELWGDWSTGAEVVSVGEGTTCLTWADAKETQCGKPRHSGSETVVPSMVTCPKCRERMTSVPTVSRPDHVSGEEVADVTVGGTAEDGT